MCLEVFAWLVSAHRDGPAGADFDSLSAPQDRPSSPGSARKARANHDLLDANQAWLIEPSRCFVKIALRNSRSLSLLYELSSTPTCSTRLNREACLSQIVGGPWMGSSQSQASWQPAARTLQAEVKTSVQECPKPPQTVGVR